MRAPYVTTVTTVTGSMHTCAATCSTTFNGVTKNWCGDSGDSGDIPVVSKPNESPLALPVTRREWCVTSSSGYV